MSLVLKAFEYLEPGTIDEAIRMLSIYGATTKVIAGGCDLLPGILRQRCNRSGNDRITNDSRENY